MAYRTTYKQVTLQVNSLENALKLPQNSLHLQGLYGYWQLNIATLNDDGGLSSATRTIASGLTLGQLSASIAMTLELIYQSNKLNTELMSILSKQTKQP